MSGGGVVRVTDRTWRDMRLGGEFERWPEDYIPYVGEIICIFDRDYEFTQHEITWRRGRNLRFGPALPWEEPTFDGERQRGEPC